MKIIILTFLYFFLVDIKAQINLMELKNLKEIIAYEVTGQVNAFSFDISDQRLRERLGPQLNINNDFGGVPGAENYDIYFSDSLGNLSALGQYITIECWYTGTSGGGGCNIADLELKFNDGNTVSSSKLASFFSSGNNYLNNSELLAIDCKKNTWSTLGNISQSNSKYLRLTFSFSNAIKYSNFKICSGDKFEYKIGNQIFNENNPNGTVIINNENGCNEKIEIVNIEIEPFISKSITFTKCLNENFNFTLNDITFNKNNPSGQVIVNSSIGCDTLYSVNIDFIETIIQEINYSGCIGDNYAIIKGGTKFDEINPTGSVLVSNSASCDTLFTINLNFIPLEEKLHSYIGCKGDGYTIKINNEIFNEQNPKGRIIAESNNSCDTIYEVNLIFDDVPEKNTILYRCKGDGYSFDNGDVILNETNPFGKFNIRSQEGCDTLNNMRLVFIECNKCNIFSPNIILLSSNINNIFSIYLDEDCIFTNTELIVFDRWGNKVHKGNDLFWNGYYKGVMCENGVYSYLFKYQIYESSFVRNGTITVLR